MQTALSVRQEPNVPQEAKPALPLRYDTILGVCEAIGEDFGFHPNYLRVVFAAGVLWNPVAILSIYLALGAIVAGSRWLFPKPAPSVSPRLAEPAGAPIADNQAEKELIAA